MASFKFSRLFMMGKTFYSFNDAAHQSDHFFDVMDQYTKIIRPYILKNINSPRFKLIKDHPDLLDQVCLSILAHDIFAYFRQGHEDMAYRFVKLHAKQFGVENEEHIELLAKAAKEHRASGSGEFTSILSEIVATADKPIPTDVEMIQRSYQFAVGFQKQTHEEALAHIASHIKAKFGTEGYAKYPPLWDEIHKDKKVDFQTRCDGLTDETVAKVFVEYPIPDVAHILPGATLIIPSEKLSDLAHWLVLAMQCMITSNEDSVKDHASNQVNAYLADRLSMENCRTVAHLILEKLTKTSVSHE